MFLNIPNLFAFIFILIEANLKLSYYMEMVVEESMLICLSTITYPLLIASSSYTKVSLLGSSKTKNILSGKHFKET